MYDTGLVNYLLLDAARAGGLIQTAKEINPAFDSLLKGLPEEALEIAGPYIFSFTDENEFGNWFFKIGWGRALGILLYAPGVPRNRLHQHFQGLLKQTNSKGEEGYFRFYDPRVLRMLLPVYDAEQLRDFFGPVEKFICEDGDPSQILQFTFNGKNLVVEKKNSAGGFPFVKG